VRWTVRYKYMDQDLHLINFIIKSYTRMRNSPDVKDISFSTCTGMADYWLHLSG